MYYLIAGIAIIFTGFVHMILGEKWIFAQLKSDHLTTHYSGNITKITLRWFWHVGSLVIFGAGILALTMGMTNNIIPNEPFMGKLLASLYLGINLLLFIVNAQHIGNIKEYPQIILMIVIMILLYVGSLH